ncbi:MAG: tRNA glutamyl-Q synthetase [Ferruginibacter sp.]|nr:tRNA glutamyl-Q synthetase [Cytophagales bacterium]
MLIIPTLSISTPVRSRLAPTPSGFLHAGNAFGFVLTWQLVRKHRGTLHLRIDDLDTARVRPAYVADIFDTLDWLGVDYDSGPRNAEEFAQRYSQRHRLPGYETTLDQLRKTGLVYACDCSRARVLATSTNNLYAGTCRDKRLNLDQPGVAWRVRVPEDTHVTFEDGMSGPQRIRLDRVMGDFVVRRRDGIPAYQIASLTDDLHDNVNLVVRGADLLPSTAAQLFLATHLPANPFPQTIFCHHPLLTDAEGRKLSKSAGAKALRTLRGEGPSPADLFGQWTGTLGYAPRRND